MDESSKKPALPLGIEISDDDVYDAMKQVRGYLDITPNDLNEVFRAAYSLAVKRISSAVTARDIMTRPVYSVGLDSSAQQVADVMAERHISGVPVVDGEGRVAGIVSEKDFLSRMGAKDVEHVMGIIAACLKGRGCVATSIRAKKAADIMSSPAVTVTAKATAFEIMEIFDRMGINRVPVVDEKECLLGIVSRADLMRAKFFGDRNDP